MKKTIFTFLAGMVILTSCSKDDDAPHDPLPLVGTSIQGKWTVDSINYVPYTTAFGIKVPIPGLAATMQGNPIQSMTFAGSGSNMISGNVSGKLMLSSGEYTPEITGTYTVVDKLHIATTSNIFGTTTDSIVLRSSNKLVLRGDAIFLHSGSVQMSATVTKYLKK